MLPRFTNRTWKVLELAEEEAHRLNHEYVGTEHILLGLVMEGSGVATQILKNLNFDLNEVRLDVERLVLSGPDMVTSGKLPQTPRARSVIEYAKEEARSLYDTHVGTKHVLVGLLREEVGTAAQILMSRGLKVESVREEAKRLHGPESRPDFDVDDIRVEAKRIVQTGPAPYDRFGEQARRVMQLAHQEAVRLKHEYMGPEHILLALLNFKELKQRPGGAASVLMDMDVDLSDLRDEVERLVAKGTAAVPSCELQQTPRAIYVIEYAVEESRNLKDKYVGTEHLLLGLLREEENLGAQILMNRGLKLENVRDQVQRILGWEGKAG